MLSSDDALEITEASYPNGVEALVEHLNVDVKESSMSGGDGWCLAHGDRAIVRLNKDLGRNRKRFVLAHELAHLVLGIPAVVGETFEGMIRSDSAEEQRVNSFAAAMLLPASVVKSRLSIPVVAGEIAKLAKEAHVSELAATIRVANSAEEIGLKNGLVVLFNDKDQVSWRMSNSLTLPIAEAKELLTETRNAAPAAFRRQQTGGGVVVASLVENRYFGSATLFVQLLSPEDGFLESRHERRLALENELFSGRVKLQKSMAGYIGALKNRIEGKTAEEVEADFWVRYSDLLKDTPMGRDIGREYVKLRVAEWY